LPVYQKQKNITNPKRYKRKTIETSISGENQIRKLIRHCLLVADIYFFLEKEAEVNKNKLHFYTKTDLSKHYYLPYNRPDAYIAIKSKHKTKRYFLEIISEDTPRFMLRSKIAQYAEYFDEKIWTVKKQIILIQQYCLSVLVKPSKHFYINILPKY